MTSSGPVCGDFHLHTRYSPDSTIEPEQLVERCLAVGINCLAVTDHDSIEGALEVARIAPFPVIVGEEVSTREGHILALFLRDYIEPGLSLGQTADRVREQGGLLFAPHPYSRLCGDSLGDALDRHWTLFDGIEVANSNSLLRADDARAEAFARRHRLPRIAGSDAHRIGGVGASRVFMPAFSGPEEFLVGLHAARLHNRLHDLGYFLTMGAHEALDRLKRLTGLGTTTQQRIAARAARYRQQLGTNACLPQAE